MRAQLELLAQPLRAYCNVDMLKQLERIGTQAAAVERGEDASLATELRVLDGRVGLVTVEMQGAAAGEVEWRNRVQVMVVAAADDRTHAMARHHERKRGFLHFAAVNRNLVLRRHVEEHAGKPIVSERRHQLRHDPKLGAAECRRHRIAPEAHRIILGDHFLVAGGNAIGHERHIDVSLADEECFHSDIPQPFFNPRSNGSISC